MSIALLFLLLAAPCPSTAQLLPTSLRPSASIAATPPGWHVYASSVCPPSALCAPSKTAVTHTETSDYQTSEAAVGLGFLAYVVGGTIGGLVTHAVAPMPQDWNGDSWPGRVLLVGSVTGAVSAGTAIHFVDGRIGHYGYTTAGAVVGNLAMVGLSSLLARLARSRENPGLGWFSLIALSVSPLASISVAAEVNQATAR